VDKKAEISKIPLFILFRPSKKVLEKLKIFQKKGKSSIEGSNNKDR